VSGAAGQKRGGVGARLRAWPREWLRARRRRLPGPGRPLQAARRGVQLAVLLGLFAVPSLSLYDTMRNQRDEARIASRWDTRAIDRAVRPLEDASVYTRAVRGSVWTLKLQSPEHELVVSDPLAALDFALAARELWDPFLLTALLPLLLSLVLGRVFCGWICPADVLFELGSRLRDRAGIERDVPLSPRIKYVVLGLGALASLGYGSQVFALFYPPRLLSSELYLWVSFGSFASGAWFLLAIVAIEVFVSRRFWCRSVCPGGALYSLLGRHRLVRLKVSAGACTGCERCQPVCEFGLDPMRGAIGQECNNCGLCVRACAPKALSWRLEPPRRRRGLDVLP
jgi:NapH/MauN family ferredoxin-type protein